MYSFGLGKANLFLKPIPSNLMFAFRLSDCFVPRKDDKQRKKHVIEKEELR